MIAPRKRKQAVPGSSSAPKKGKVCFREVFNIFSILLSMGKSALCCFCILADSNLLFVQLWKEDDEEDMTNPTVMGATEPNVKEDQIVTMKDIFGDLH